MYRFASCLAVVVVVCGVGLATVVNADTVLVDINGGSSGWVATVTDFTNVGVTGLTGSETVDTLREMPFGPVTLTTVGGVTIAIDTDAESYVLNDVESTTLHSPNLMRDYLFLRSGAVPVNVSLGSLGLDPSTAYTLYLFGNTDPGLPGQEARFTPTNYGNIITYDSTDADVGSLAAGFTTGAGYVDGIDTVDFVWEVAGTNAYGVFNGFAIIQVPEPSSVGLLAGLAFVALAARCRRR